MTDPVAEVAMAARPRRRGPRTITVIGGIALLAGTWWVVAAQGTVETGTTNVTGGGYRDECMHSDDDIWAVFAKDQSALVVQTIANWSWWPVEVISPDPEVYRFGPVNEEPDEYYVPSPRDGVPDDTSHRMVVAPGKEVALWIIEPFSDDLRANMRAENSRTGIGGVDLEVRSLGLPHRERIEFDGSLWLSSNETDSDAFQNEIEEMCHNDE